MWLTIGIILAILWGLGVFVFDIAGSLIHLLIILAVISVLLRVIFPNR